MIRPTLVSDAPTILAIASGTGVFKPHEIQALDEVLTDYHAVNKSLGHVSVTLELDGEILGFAYYAPASMTDRTWYLYWIAVTRERQARGIGSQLLVHAENEIRAQNGRLLLIETSSLAHYEPTRRFYAKHDYDETAVIRDFYADDDDMVIFSKRLTSAYGTDCEPMDIFEIREEQPADFSAIRAVVTAAFGQDAEARLVDALREEGYSRLALVATVDRQIVGYSLLSDLPIETATGTIAALALAPVAVVPARQSQGIGSQLIRAGLARAAEQGHRIVVVLGHRHYYPRFGFSAELARPLASPYAGDSFMALELVPGALTGVTGEVRYPPPFSAF